MTTEELEKLLAQQPVALLHRLARGRASIRMTMPIMGTCDPQPSLHYHSNLEQFVTADPLMRKVRRGSIWRESGSSVSRGGGRLVHSAGATTSVRPGGVFAGVTWDQGLGAGITYQKAGDIVFTERTPREKLYDELFDDSNRLSRPFDDPWSCGYPCPVERTGRMGGIVLSSPPA